MWDARWGCELVTKDGKTRPVRNTSKRRQSCGYRKISNARSHAGIFRTCTSGMQAAQGVRLRSPLFLDSVILHIKSCISMGHGS